MKVFFSLLFSCCIFSALAQNNISEIIKEQMIKDWERAKVYTREYLDAMPAAKYQFRAVDSIRSFAQQMLHLAAANVSLATVATSIPDSGFQNVRKWNSFEEAPSMQNKDSVIHYVSTSYDIVINSIKALDIGKYSEIVNQRTRGGERSETRFAWLMKAFEHQTHHRGQCTIYIRLSGITPPAEKLF